MRAQKTSRLPPPTDRHTVNASVSSSVDIAHGISDHPGVGCRYCVVIKRLMDMISFGPRPVASIIDVNAVLNFLMGETVFNNFSAISRDDAKRVVTAEIMNQIFNALEQGNASFFALKPVEKKLCVITMF